MAMAEEQEITAPLDIETLQTSWAEKASAVPRCHAYISFGAKTDLGRVRENNEDKFDYFEPGEPAPLAVKGRVYAVADGMGGHSAGQIASELSLNGFIRAYYADPRDEIEASLKAAVQEANAYVVDVARTIPGRAGMGATLTAAVVREDDLYIAQVGDSRGYLLRDGRLDQITEDHSWVAEQVRAGTMTLEEAEASPFRNVITRSMGGSPAVEADIYAVKLQVGDRILLCSDGLSGMVSDPELADLLSSGSPSEAAWNMVQRANECGGKDNITAFVLHVVDIQPWPEAEDASKVTGEQADYSAPEHPEGAVFDAEGESAVSPDGEVAFTAASAVENTGPNVVVPPSSERAGLIGRLFRRA